MDWEDNRTLFAATDHLDSTRMMVNPDDKFNENEIEFSPFGTMIGPNTDLSTTHLFTGHERDLDGMSGLDYMHARYYSPFLARFLSVDPVQGTVGGSQSWNRYSYVLNNPLKYVDPDGENPFAAVVALITTTRVTAGATTGAITGGVLGLAKGQSIKSGIYGAAKGAVIGGANAIPVVGGSAAAYGFDVAEQLVKGASLAEANSHAVFVATVTGGMSAVAFVVTPKTNAIGGVAVVFAAASAAEAATGYVDVLSEAKLTEQDGASVKDQNDQWEALKEEGEVGCGTTDNDEKAP